MSLAFLLTSLIVVASPGTGVLYTLATALTRGARASVAAAFGCTLGILPAMLAAMVGLAAVLHTSALAFAALKWLGVGYLLYMAWQSLREQGALSVEARKDDAADRRVIVKGFLINILNPKLSIFFLAFLPQFVDMGRGHVASQIALLGLMFIALGLVSDSCYALAAGAAGQWLKKSRAWLRLERAVGDSLMIGLGVTAAVAGGERK